MAVQAYKTKAGRRYLAEFQSNGQRVTRGGFTLKADAAAWIADERRRLKAMAKQASCPKSTLPFSMLFAKYLDYCQGRMQPGTIRQKEFVSAQAIKFWKVDPEADAITRGMILDFLQAEFEATGAKNANRRLRDLKAMFNRAMREGWVSSNPAASVDPYAEDEFVKYFPPAEDVAAVMLAAEPWQREIIEVFYHTGARLSEILLLTWEHVNLELRWVRLHTRKRKGGAKEPRLVPMNDPLYSILHRRWNERDKDSPYVFTNPLTGGHWRRQHYAIKNLMRQLCERAGVRFFTIHALRHHVASIVLDSGKANMRQIQNFLGHKRLSTTEIYAKSLTPSEVEIGEILAKSQIGVPNETPKKKIPGPLSKPGNR